ncbi:molybdenum cofactor guanylyltransferase [Paenibacillus sp. sgz302251]|uniref:molybdenum cofactor guanylyltransferase n=1 Tax=Paenibacillus sp. sgz302251 TaxID=3414493 RepID=UPI003C7A84C0
MKQRQEIVGLILAGGQSLRMGTDKAMLQMNGRPLLYRLVQQLYALTASITVSIGSLERETGYREALGEYANEVEFVVDRFPGCGPLSGLHAGLSHIKAEYVFVIACDMPTLSLPVFQLLATHRESGADVIHTAGQPFHALYHTRTSEQIQAALEAKDYRLMSLLRQLHTAELPSLETDSSTLFANLNTQDDYKRYLEKYLEA